MEYELETMGLWMQEKGHTTTNAQTFTPPASSFLTSAHTHFWRSLLFWQEWCECKELGARNDMHAKAAMYAHLAKDKANVSSLIIVIVYSTHRLRAHMRLLRQFLRVVQQIVLLS